MTKKNKAKLLPYLPHIQISIRILLGLVLLSIACLVGRCNSQTTACPDGWVEWEGHCAAIPQPEAQSVKEFQPSNEKPPRHPEPPWQRGDVIADMPQSLASQDAKLDQERAEADAQGKKAAGVP